MKKEDTRPLLVKALERARMLEEEAYQSATQASRLNWPELAATLKKTWDRRRLERAQAELALWLADREWEREERAEAQQSASLSGKT